MDLSDEKIYKLKKYENYLDYLLKLDDFLYLESTLLPRLVVELGYNAISKTYTRQEFLDRLDGIEEQLHPSMQPHKMFSYGLTFKGEGLLKHLALRERPNRVGTMSTIIYIRQKDPSGVEVSGHIDFQQSLRNAKTRQKGANDWFNIFRGNELLRLQKSDLSYYDWILSQTKINQTENYKPLCDENLGLIFMNRRNRQIIKPNPFLSDFGAHTYRTTVK